MKTLEDRFNDKIQEKQDEINNLKLELEQKQADIDYMAIMLGVDL